MLSLYWDIVFSVCLRIHNLILVNHYFTVNVTGVGSIVIDWLKPFFIIVTKQSGAVSPLIQHAISRRLGDVWGAGVLNTRFSPPTVLYAGYSKKLKKIWNLRNHFFYFKLFILLLHKEQILTTSNLLPFQNYHSLNEPDGSRNRQLL